MYKKCEWCEDGICIYDLSVDEQLEDEERLSTAWCDGSIEMQIECGMIKE